METCYVAGHRGMVGSAVWRALSVLGERDLVGRASAELDLRDRAATFEFVLDTKPSSVVIAAATVGGILTNDSRPVDFLSDNVLIQTNLLDACHAAAVERVLFLGSSCIYPRDAPQPIRETALLSGPLEPTNQAYAIAKIAGVMLVQAYRRQHGHRWISAMPTNLYGPGDTFDPLLSHVVPAMIVKFDAARRAGTDVVLWGTGTPRRDLLHVDDAASAVTTVLDHYDDDLPINIGTGTDVTVLELAQLVAEVVGYSGQVRWDETRPDGTPRKLLDVSRLRALGWAPSIPLREGIETTYDWFLSHGSAPSEGRGQ